MGCGDFRPYGVDVSLLEFEIEKQTEEKIDTAKWHNIEEVMATHGMQRNCHVVLFLWQFAGILRDGWWKTRICEYKRLPRLTTEEVDEAVMWAQMRKTGLERVWYEV